MASLESMTQDPGRAQSPLEQPHRCSICNSSFTRREHLTRHLRRHTKEKPHRCQECEKSFSRADVLSRHRQSHALEGGGSSARKEGSFRACLACAAGRNRCSGGIPCLTCAKKVIECVYPSRLRDSGSTVTKIHSHIEPSTNHAIHPPETDWPVQGNTEEDLAQDQIMSGMRINISTDGRPAPATLTGGQGENFFEPYPGMYGSQFSNGWTGQSYSLQYDQLAGSGETGLGDRGLGSTLEQVPNSGAFPTLNWITPNNEFSRVWNYQNNVAPDDAFPVASELLSVYPGAVEDAVLVSTRSGLRNHTIQRTESLVPPPIVPTSQESPNNDSPASSSRARSGSVADSLVSSTLSSKYYIDNAGARASMQELRKRRLAFHGTTNTSDQILHGRHSGANVEQPSAINLPSSNADIATFTQWVSLEMYDSILEHLEYQTLPDVAALGTSSFPPLAIVNKFCDLYFAKFHSGFPFLSKTLFQPVGDVWVLVLAIATVGARYSKSADFLPFQNCLINYLDGAIDAITATGENVHYATMPFTHSATEHSLELLQARILNVLLLVRGGRSTQMEKALSNFSLIVATCNHMRLLQSAEENMTDVDLSREDSHDQGVFQHELRIRTGYMIWMMDGMFMYEFNQVSRFELADIQAPLPCHEGVWEDYERHDTNRLPPTVTMSEALEILYAKKKLEPTIGEFSRILLIQAICQQTMEMSKYTRNRMSDWTPSAKVESQVVFKDAEFWPPSSPSMSKWRNSACDCLDVLHWSANSKVAQSAGFEHLTVLHLHLARLIILTPHQAIRDLASFCITKYSMLASQTNFRFELHNNKAGNEVLKWAVHDQCKARLSMVHAGAIFWHIRRYSCDSLVEPFALYISTLALWAFSVSTQHVQNNERSTTSNLDTGLRWQADTSSLPLANETADSELDISTINLDRPCDDETVQTYVRVGFKMTANMARVGSVCETGAPAKILREGLLLFGTENLTLPQGQSQIGSGDQRPDSEDTWGISKSYMHSLQRLGGLYALI